MHETFSVRDLIRNLFKLIGWGGGALLLTGLTGLMIPLHYLAWQSALELQGYESKPLASDGLWGAFFATFMPDVTLAHLIAIMGACALVIGFFMFIHYMVAIHQCWADRRVYRAQEDEQSAYALRERIARYACYAVLLLIGLVLVVAWDIDLFRYRSLAGALDIDAPQKATSSIPALPVFLERHGDLFVSQLTILGPWGNLGVTVVLCVVLELCMLHMGEAWARFIAPVDALLRPSAPLSADEPRQRIQPEQQERGLLTQSGSSATPRQHSDESLTEHTVSAESQSAPEVDHSGSQRATEVIGAAPNTMVHLADALRDEGRYRVDERTHQVWDRTYWNALHAE